MSAHRHLLLLWLAVAAVLVLLAALLVANSDKFDWQLAVTQVPAAWLAFGVVAAGAVYLALPALIGSTLAAPPVTRRQILRLIILVGLGLRLALFFTEPALEDDHNRFLWEGALVANGISPYAVSPEAAHRAGLETRLGRLAQEAGPILDRVNHPELTSTYPPVAQAAFAVSYLIAPWSLTAWRLILLACDLACAALLIALLRQAGRSELWVALYFWNPIVIKELINSAHMEGVLMALVLAALLLLTRKRHGTGLAVLGLAIGTKLWPVLLAPLFLRRLWPRPVAFVAGTGLLGLMCVLWLLPAYLGGIGAESGYAAYLQRWATNSALLPLLEAGSVLAQRLVGGWQDLSWAIARAAIGGGLGVFAVWQAWRPLGDTDDVLQRATLIATALVLLSPAQFPWYMIWVLPFTVFRPYWGLLAINVTVPLYYLSFHYIAQGAYPVFRDRIVWLIWVPIWVLLAAEAWRARRDRAGVRREEASPVGSGRCPAPRT
jgi:alpha-1,6-mannosyltransferase